VILTITLYYQILKKYLTFLYFTAILQILGSEKLSSGIVLDETSTYMFCKLSHLWRLGHWNIPYLFTHSEDMSRVRCEEYRTKCKTRSWKRLKIFIHLFSPSDSCLGQFNVCLNYCDANSLWHSLIAVGTSMLFSSWHWKVCDVI
jgi:hypothetical protein